MKKILIKMKEHYICIIVVVAIILLFFIGNINYILDNEHCIENAKLENVVMRTENTSKQRTGIRIYYIYTFITNEKKRVTCINKDSLYLMKFNSGDFECMLKKGKTYNVVYRGCRWHLLSTYPNIVDLKDMK